MTHRRIDIEKIDLENPENDPLLNLARDESEGEYSHYLENPRIAIQVVKQRIAGASSGAVYCRNPYNLKVGEGSESQRYLIWHSDADGCVVFD